MEVIALIVSCISLGISIYTLYQNHKINCTNLQSGYYKKIFEKYLLEEIPIAVRYIEFNHEGKLNKDYKELNKVLLGMLDDCTYFAYANNPFYEKIRCFIINIDENLVEVSSKIVTNSSDQALIIFNIHQDIQSLFKLINKSYMS